MEELKGWVIDIQWPKFWPGRIYATFEEFVEKYFIPWTEVFFSKKYLLDSVRMAFRFNFYLLF